MTCNIANVKTKLVELVMHGIVVGIDLQTSITFIDHPHVELLLTCQFSRLLIRQLARHEHAR